ncbi:MAG: anaerobic ribonucleoside-triphosphate reductase activating protein [Bacteroidaceae bacterium]|nr:anaerobic ribonucleoside-triphosphate reductase activating protein [Bacteroidaceae bacterium]
MSVAISILEIVQDTTVDGPGLRTSIYCAGCPNRCPGCHNPQSWDIKNGHYTDIEDIMRPIEEAIFSDVTFSGGDPMFQPEGFTELARTIKKRTNKNIWCYTGFLFEEIMENDKQRELLQYIDILVDGRFVETLKDEKLLFRGSSNQRIIDVQRSLQQGETVLWKEER